jgi:hypothetical protein
VKSFCSEPVLTVDELSRMGKIVGSSGPLPREMGKQRGMLKSSIY